MQPGAGFAWSAARSREKRSPKPGPSSKRSSIGSQQRIDVSKPIGNRITEMTLLKTGEPIDPAKEYVISGWASVNEDTEGPAIWDVCESYIKRVGTVRLDPNTSVKVTGA